MTQSFIERQFPVSKVSKESFKERKAVQSQTLTGLGKWWGRKPLVLVRATILGCLLPCTENAEKDMDIFLKIMGMDHEGLILRKEKKFSVKDLFHKIKDNNRLWAKYGNWFELDGDKPILLKGAPRQDIEEAVFATLRYDEKLIMCMRPEHLGNITNEAWRDINHHLGTHATCLVELVRELSQKKYGHVVKVGDCFCGGGSIPFEAARIGCNAYASDLNPIAGLLTWADLNICGASQIENYQIRKYLEEVYFSIDKEICELGIEHNENGERAHSYLYCVETVCPECGWRIPMLPTFVVGIRAGRSILKLKENNGSFDIAIYNSVTEKELSEAKAKGTVKNNSLICPHCGKSTPISSLRHDRIDRDGTTKYGIRLWERNEYEPRIDDLYQEKLFAIRYERKDGKRYYRAPNEHDLKNEEIIHKIVSDNITKWQDKGLVPSSEIEPGEKTEEVIRTRGWKYWHQLFYPRQLFVLSRFAEYISKAKTKTEKVAGLLGLHRLADYSSKICRWDPSTDISKQTFYNQAFNTLYNWGARAFSLSQETWIPNIGAYNITDRGLVNILDARGVKYKSDIWITDPPYADAVNYHELTEFFLAWDRTLLKDIFPEWYIDSKRVLAVRGDEHFSQTMIDIYSNLTRHMSDNGMQVVMFTHSNPAVWAQLALIMWKSGLTVTAAWNIATETDASGLKDGNFVKGTVLLVLRKQLGEEEAFLDELFAEVKSEVKNQIESMQDLDDREDPNFSDPDYVLAAYAASLKVLTGYKSIVEIDLDYELDLAIHDPSKSEVVKLIERAKKIAYDFIIPLDFDHFLWRDLSAAERFYVKGLEAEKHGNYQVSTYQEYARGFGLTSYSQLMASERANTARLKVPQEFSMRTVGDVPGFEQSILRLVLASIHVAIKEDENPEKGFWHIKNNLADYWGRRDMLRQLFSFLKDTEDIDTMPHWHEAAIMASHIYTMIDNDHI